MFSNSRSSDSKSAFNLGKFYQDLTNVESSIGKRGNSVKNNNLNHTSQLSSLALNTKSYLNSFHKKNLQQVTQNVQNSKLHLQSSNLSKNKINNNELKHSFQNHQESRVFRGTQQVYQNSIDSPFDKIKNKYTTCEVQTKYKNQSHNHLTKKAKHQQKSWQTYTEPFQREIIQRLSQSRQSLKSQKLNQIKTKMQKAFYKNTSSGLKIKQKSMTDKLLEEIRRRNQCYRIVSKQLQGKSKKSYLSKEENVAILMEESQRQCQTMNKIIQHFKKICGLQIDNFDEILSFLKTGGSQHKIQEPTLIQINS